MISRTYVSIYDSAYESQNTIPVSYTHLDVYKRQDQTQDIFTRGQYVRLVISCYFNNDLSQTPIQYKRIL